MSTWIGEDNYPTEECLEYLKECPASEAFEILRENWWPFDGTGVSEELSPGERSIVETTPSSFLRFATGGWSGNEDMMHALTENYPVMACWRLSARGGLHIFEVDS